MTMSLGYTIGAAVALMLSLFWDNRRAGSAGQIVSALAMAVGLWWISLPDPLEVHPASAVMSSDNVGFKIAAFGMVAGCLVWVFATAVPVRRWLQRSEGSA